MSEAYIISHQNLLAWVGELAKDRPVFGPVEKRRRQVVFEQASDPASLALDYRSTMLAPRRFIYPARQTLFQMDLKTGDHRTVSGDESAERVIFAVHPCDMHAISVLDRIFLGGLQDVYYARLRQSTLTVVLNCNQACDSGFCDSMGTGPFLQLECGFDVVLTARTDDYLMEFGSKQGQRQAKRIKGLKKASGGDFAEKRQIEAAARASFTKRLDTGGLPQLLMRNLDHPVYKATAEARCLGCTNCTMVCPTCYCYNIEDRTPYDLKAAARSRYWDSCQELNFAKVHEGNFRSSRQARLRQFVTHKLATWIEQYGCFGCIGCGRCMIWCPTKIDLTEMAKEIQRDAAAGRAR